MKILLRSLIALTTVTFCATAGAEERSGFGMSVLVDDAQRPEYVARGTVYVEALHGANYALRITNPTPDRVAVALSVDGLNTIDAKHTDPWHAAKWVLEPYESTVISGWQVNDRTARSFFFSTETNSYGAAIGQTTNLGVIEAVFYRERRPKIDVYAAPMEKSQGGSRAPSAAAQPAPSDDYAATGMGRRTQHEIEMVDIDLEPAPAGSLRIRYEFRPQLVKLGVLPRDVTPLDRRERARGFERYCPEPSQQ